MNTIISRPEFSDLMPRQGSFLRQCLDGICNPRRHRWAKYLRWCKKIPTSSPVYGSTSFLKLNKRRIELITTIGGKGKWDYLDENPEFIVLQKATGIWCCGQMVADNFLNARILRRMGKIYPAP